MKPAIRDACTQLHEVLRAKIPPQLPAELNDEQELKELRAELLELRRFVMAIANGDLSTALAMKGYTAGALKTLQANLKHLSWQTKLIAAGDFSQRLDFMGDFSEAFNSMAERLETSQRIIQDKEAELTRINTGLKREIEGRKQVQAALAAREAHYRNLTETMKDVVWVLDTTSLRFTYVSPSVFSLRGFTPEEVMAQPLEAALTAGQGPLVKAAIAQRCEEFLAGRIGSQTYFTSEIEQPCKDGSTVWTEVVSRYVKNDQSDAVELHGVTRDISERRTLRLELERQASMDSLTGTANRRHFLDTAQKEIHRARRHGNHVTLLMLDIDHFKAVNDTHGHAMGDLCLQAVARACADKLRQSDLIGRIGGEEFAMLLAETDLKQALEVAQRLRTHIRSMDQCTCNSQTVQLTVSIGAAQYNGQESLSELMNRADKALYRAKHLGRDRVESD